jgi:DNA invertase Pin-like site-specific DNA recombinase
MITATASGELMVHIIGALAQFERSLIHEGLNAGRATARNAEHHRQDQAPSEAATTQSKPPSLLSESSSTLVPSI